MELRQVIESLRSSAPAPNLIYIQFLKNVLDNVIFELLSIYNHIWTNHIFLTTWKTATVLSFLKPEISWNCHIQIIKQ